MIHGGLVSVSFRTLNPEQIITMTRDAGLTGIEWGGDVHAPHGDVPTAKRVGRLTREAGLHVAAYGSYYRLGETGSDSPDFRNVLDSAVALEAPTIRVWASRRGTRDAKPEDWARVVEDAKRIADLAQAADTRVCIEYHEGTLTDHHESAIDLHDRIAHDNVDLLWQPPYYHDHATNLRSVTAMLSRISNVHVYWWTKGASGEAVRHPLSEAAEQWRGYLDVLAGSPRDRYALLEFVKDDDPERFRHDAATFATLLGG